MDTTDTTAATKIEVYELDLDNDHRSLFEQINNWSCGLWWGDFEEAHIDRCYVAFTGDDTPVGFLTVNADGFCVAIEVHPDYQGQGIGLQLVEESGCYRPDRNECPEFWKKVQEKFQ